MRVELLEFKKKKLVSNGIATTNNIRVSRVYIFDYIKILQSKILLINNYYLPQRFFN